MIVASGQDLLSKLESQRTVKVLITLKVRLNLFILSSWVYFVTYFLYCAVEHCALMNKRVTSSAIFFFFCIKILNISSVNDYSIGSTVPNWILVTIVLMCPVLCDCCLTALRWFSSSDAVCFFVLGDLWLFWDEEKKKLFVRPSRSINGGRGGGRSRSQPKYSLHRKSAHSWCLNKVLFIIRMATAALSSTLEHRKVLWMLGDLSLTTSFFYSPPPPTHTHIVFSSLICSNGYDSPLPFAKTFNFSFKYQC